MSSSSSEWWARRPLVIAHRGAARLAPENTLTAFRLAADLGADAVELDARLTADGEVVVLHDKLLDRTTNGSGLVSRRTRQELQTLDAGAKSGPGFAGERIPTLDQVFEAVGSRVLINVELKNYDSAFDRLVATVAARVRAMDCSAECSCRVSARSLCGLRFWLPRRSRAPFCSTPDSRAGCGRSSPASLSARPITRKTP